MTSLDELCERIMARKAKGPTLSLAMAERYDRMCMEARRISQEQQDFQADHDEYLDELGMTARDYREWTHG